MTGLFLVLGYSLGGQTGMVIALIIALGMNFFFLLAVPYHCIENVPGKAAGAVPGTGTA